MKKIVLILLLSAFVLAYGQDFRENAANSMFSDFKGLRVGDAITIIVMESTEASNQAEKSAGRTSDLSLKASGQLDKSPLPTVDVGIGTANNFKGGGTSTTGGTVKTKITCIIDTVYANGNIRVKGSRKIVVNEEEQVLKIKGVVRPPDIQSDNSVYSYNLSDAEIIFEGNGMINRNTDPGWLTKLFHWLF